MNKLKFHAWDIVKVDEDEVEIKFKVKFLKGVDQIIQAFQSGKQMVEGKLIDGALGVISLFSTIYTWIKSGKK